jgi:hypothetical protein
VKNITVSVPDGVYRAARVQAAERETSVSGLVAEYLGSLSQQGSGEFERLEAQQRRIQQEIRGFSARRRAGREDVHGRAIR